MTQDNGIEGLDDAFSELKAWIVQEIKTAQGDWEESFDEDQNCFGSGYDRGYLDGLTQVFDRLPALKAARGKDEV